MATGRSSGGTGVGSYGTNTVDPGPRSGRIVYGKGSSVHVQRTASLQPAQQVQDIP